MPAINNLGPWASTNKGAVIASWTKGARAGIPAALEIPRIQFFYIDSPAFTFEPPTSYDFLPIVPPNHGSHRSISFLRNDPSQPDWPWYGTSNGPADERDLQFGWPTGVNPDGTWTGTPGGTQTFSVDQMPGADGRGVYDDTFCQTYGTRPYILGAAFKIRLIGPLKGTLLTYPEIALSGPGYVPGGWGDPLGGYNDKFGNPVYPNSAGLLILRPNESYTMLPSGGTCEVTGDPTEPYTFTSAPLVFRLGKTPADFGF